MLITDTEQLKDFIIECLLEKKAEDIVTIDLSNKTQLAKYMIFANGRSIKNNAAIAEYLSFELKNKTNLAINIEGMGKSEWVLVDAGDIIVHIFYPTAREHLRLEEKWNKVV